MSHTSFTSDLSGFDLVTPLNSIVIYKINPMLLTKSILVTTLHYIVIYKFVVLLNIGFHLVTTLHYIVIYKV